MDLSISKLPLLYRSCSAFVTTGVKSCIRHQLKKLNGQRRNQNPAKHDGAFSENSLQLKSG